MNQRVVNFVREMLATHRPPYITEEEFRPGESTVHYAGPWWDERELAAAIDTLLMGKWLPSGERVRQFEHAFSAKFRNDASLMVNSGSSANLVMIAAAKRMYGWEDGDEIIVSAVGFPTTYAPIVQCGLRPVFVDIEFGRLNFDLSLVRSAMTRSTRAILIAPVLGNPPDMDRLAAMGVPLLLDNCDSLGSKWRGRYLNEFVEASSCSFYPAHHITTGEGGMVSGTEDFVALARRIAWWGRDCYCVGSANDLPNGTCKRRFSEWLVPKHDGLVDHKYVFTELGYNLKPLDLQGAIGLEQLAKFDEIHARRRANHARLGAIVRTHLAGVHVPCEMEGAETSWFGLPIVCRDRAHKTWLQQHLERAKIQTRNFFAGNILMHPAYAHLGDYREFPVANTVLDRVLFIGVAPHYSDAIFEYVASVMGEYDAATQIRLAESTPPGRGRGQ